MKLEGPGSFCFIEASVQHPQFLGHKKKLPAGCLHPSQGDTFTDPPPPSSFIWTERGPAHAGSVFRTVAPSVAEAACAECPWVLLPN
jgi:hypothetical protein